MKKRKFGLALSLVLAAGTVLGACGSDDAKEKDSPSDSTEKAFSVAMVTDVGGVDDKSFNQSAWEGLKAYGEENGLKKGKGGFDYLQSTGDADYTPHLNTLVRNDFDLIYGIGYLLAPAVEEVAKQQPDAHFAIVDSVINQPNVASITFKEHEGSFLVGVAAAKASKTNKIGFIGGVEGDLIIKFESGFIAGVKSVNPDAEVLVRYAGDFGKPDLGKEHANALYKQGVDVIYHSSGGTGNGVFAAAKEIKKSDPSKDAWVIGVDRDQYEEGVISEGNSVTLTSMVKRVDIAVADLATKAKGGDFPGGEEIQYGLNEDAISVATTGDNMSEEIVKEIDEWQAKIVSGELKVPSTRDEVEAFNK